MSTDQEEQLLSYENQVNYYTNYISENPLYEYAGTYADEGISGTNTKKRDEFNRMIADCRAGKIDMIITKSISRFARNTLDCLNYVRELKDLGIGIIFEKENINTLDAKGEVLLTILSSLAQDESRSISENCTWGIRRRFETGKHKMSTKRFLGYDTDETGKLVINRTQEPIVIRLYQEFLDGKTTDYIKRIFEREGVKNWDGGTKWQSTTLMSMLEIVSLTFDLYLLNVGSSRIGELLDYLGVKTVTGTTWESGTIDGMLCNEKYKGDFHLQKYYTPENKRNHTRKNNGEVQSYYISENHEPIVSPEVWEKVQEVREQRKRDRNIGQDSTMKFQNRYPLSGMLICPYCGKTLRRRQVYKKKIQWLCSTYIEKGVKACKGIRIDDAELQGLNITEQTVIEEVVKNGKKHYCYTSKADFDCGIRNSTVSAEIEDGSVLPSVNRPRRTVIKL